MYLCCHLNLDIGHKVTVRSGPPQALWPCFVRRCSRRVYGQPMMSCDSVTDPFSNARSTRPCRRNPHVCCAPGVERRLRNGVERGMPPLGSNTFRELLFCGCRNFFAHHHLVCWSALVAQGSTATPGTIHRNRLQCRDDGRQEPIPPDTSNPLVGPVRLTTPVSMSITPFHDRGWCSASALPCVPPPRKAPVWTCPRWTPAPLPLRA